MKEIYMKKINFKIPIIIALLLFFSGMTIAQDLETDLKKMEFPSELALAVFISLKNDNYREFYKCIADKEDMEKILKIKRYESETQKERALAMIDDFLYSLRRDAKASFEKVIEDGEDYNIIWEEAVFDEAEYFIEREDKISMTDITVYFRYLDDNYYMFKIIGCMKSHKGWKLFGELKWLGEY